VSFGLSSVCYGCSVSVAEVSAPDNTNCPLPWEGTDSLHSPTQHTSVTIPLNVILSIHAIIILSKPNIVRPLEGHKVNNNNNKHFEGFPTASCL
jgi:hypothetical protein